MFVRHQRDKNVLDKASDRYEHAKADFRNSAYDRPVGDALKDSVKSSYYEVKERAQQK